MNEKLCSQTVKKLLSVYNLLFLFVFIFSLPPASSAQETSHFFPVEMDKQAKVYMVILPFTCNLNDKIEWGAKYQSALNGLKPNSNVTLHHKESEPIQGTLGAPTCFSGACSANYVALPVKVHLPLKEVIVISKSNLRETLNVKIMHEKCREVPVNHKHPYGFNFITLPTECEILTLDNKVIGELLSFGWKQDNGWNVFHQFFRSVNYDRNNKKKYGKLEEIAYSTSKQQPIFGFYGERGEPHLLWHEKSGLGPVSRFTLRESSFDKYGNLKWTSEYKAGGQPCD